MTLEEISNYLVRNGYIDRKMEAKEFKMLFRIGMQIVDAVLLVDATRGLEVTAVDIKFAQESLTKMVRGEMHLLTLVITNDSWMVHRLEQECQFCWGLNAENGQVIIDENQVQEFYGLRNLLEHFPYGIKENDFKKKAANQGGGADAASANAAIGNKRRASVNSLSSNRFFRRPIVTYGLLVANIIVFLVCTLGDKVLYNGGMLFGPYVLERGEYYRLLTSMFLHGGVEHLVSNMLVLMAMGELIEDYYGHVRYGILYLLAGIGGGVASIWYTYHMDKLSASVGASGAIFGLVGAALFLVIANRGFFQNISMARILFAIGYSIYAGVRSSNIDNAAHIGGLVAGFFIAGILELTLRKGKARE